MRLFMPSLSRSLEMCALIVAVLRCSSDAICALVWPRASASTICRSRGRQPGERRLRPGVRRGVFGGPVHQPPGDRRGQDRVAGGHRNGSRGRSRRRGVLQQEAARAEPQRLQDVVVAVEGGQHDHLRRAGLLAQPAGRLEPALPPHPEVHEDDVDGGGAGRRAGISSPSPACPTTVISPAPSSIIASPFADQRVVVDQEHPDRELMPAMAAVPRSRRSRVPGAGRARRPPAAPAR